MAHQQGEFSEGLDILIVILREQKSKMQKLDSRNFSASQNKLPVLVIKVKAGCLRLRG